MRDYTNREDREDEEGGQNMSEPTKEYWEAKAELCRQTAEDQLMNLDTANAMRNIQRMVYALSKVQGIVTQEGDGVGD